MTLTLAEWHAWRDTDAEVVDAIRARLVAAGAVWAVARLDRLSDAERALLARFERQQAQGLPAISGVREFNPRTFTRNDRGGITSMGCGKIAGNKSGRAPAVTGPGRGRTPLGGADVNEDSAPPLGVTA